jgi:hypothetical protein
MNHSPSMPDTHNVTPEEIVSGLTVEWLFDKRVMALTAQHTDRELVDAWANKIIEVASTWSTERRLFILNDFSGKKCVVTPYNQQKNRELTKMFPNIKSSTAMIVQQNLTMQLSRLFVRMLPQNPHRLIFMTFSRAEALDWLKQQIKLDETKTAATR